MPPLSRRVAHVQPGSPVSAGNTSAATRTLEARDERLYEIVQAMEAGKSLWLRDVVVDPTVVPAAAVYWDDAAQAFLPAVAATTTDPNTAAITAASSSRCVGICSRKSADTVGDIVLLGAVFLTGEQLDVLLEGDAVSGRYFLSGVTAGKLTAVTPGVPVPVAELLGPVSSCTGGAWLVVSPHLQPFLDGHRHQQFELTALPAGTHTPPAVDGEHEITDPDAASLGWLPADHASFDGRAPDGAVFGYNLSADASLSANWPPIPAAAAVLEMLQPDEAVTDRVQGLVRVPPELVQIDRYGIWWMTACYGQVPWPATLDTAASNSSSASAAAVCPVLPSMRLLLSYLRMTFANDRHVVTSLQIAEGSPLRLVDCNSVDAQTGDLTLSLELAADNEAEDTLTSTVVKRIGSTDLTTYSGHAVAGLYAGSANVELSGTRTRRVSPSSPASASNPLVHQGLVRVDLATSPADREMQPQIARLGDAQERSLQGIDYLAFPQGQNSAIRLQFCLPSAGLPEDPELTIRLQIWGLAEGPLCAMTLQYSRVPTAADGLITPPSGATAGSLDATGQSADLTTGKVVQIVSEPIPVAAGDTVYVEIGRAAAATPTFFGEIGIIRATGVITAAET